MISISEILVSVTSLEFAYAQAPSSMKATCTSLFLLTTAVGDTLGAVMYANLAPVMSSSLLFFFCAAMMVLNTFLFAWVARKFVPRNSMTDTMDNSLIVGQMDGYKAPASMAIAATKQWDVEDDDDDDDEEDGDVRGDDAAMDAI